ncbi:MAG TPA: sulfite exporter TauE/SafE family protein [Paludibaculum sp.]|jgi:hypothetical protein
METLAGFLIGAIIGMTGVGGGVVTAPVLILFFGMQPAQSVGTALLFSAVVKVGSTLVYLVRRQVDFRVLGWMLAGGAPGALAGSLLLTRVRGLRESGVVLAIIGACVVSAALLGLRGIRSGNRPAQPNPARLPWFTLPIGLEVGFSSAGAGALGSLLMLQCTALAPVRVVGTDLLFGLGLSLIGGSVHLAAGNWDQPALLRLVLGGIVGAPLGALAAGWIPAKPLRTGLLLWSALLGGVLLVQGLFYR